MWGDTLNKSKPFHITLKKKISKFDKIKKIKKKEEENK